MKTTGFFDLSMGDPFDFIRAAKLDFLAAKS
jgi:hypothetical protein